MTKALESARKFQASVREALQAARRINSSPLLSSCERLAKKVDEFVELVKRGEKDEAAASRARNMFDALVSPMERVERDLESAEANGADKKLVSVIRRMASGATSRSLTDDLQRLDLEGKGLGSSRRTIHEAIMAARRTFDNSTVDAWLQEVVNSSVYNPEEAELRLQRVIRRLSGMEGMTEAVRILQSVSGEFKMSALDELRLEDLATKGLTESYRNIQRALGQCETAIYDVYVLSEDNDLAKISDRIEALSTKLETMRVGAIQQELTGLTNSLIQLRSKYPKLDKAISIIGRAMGETKSTKGLMTDLQQIHSTLASLINSVTTFADPSMASLMKQKLSEVSQNIPKRIPEAIILLQRLEEADFITGPGKTAIRRLITMLK